MPSRIQRSRAKGWRMPEGAIYVGRPTKFGNPFEWQNGVEIGNEGWARGAAVDMFRRWLVNPDCYLVEPNPPTNDEIRAALRGHDLCCWCPLVDANGKPVPCHADVLIEIANG